MPLIVPALARCDGCGAEAKVELRFHRLLQPLRIFRLVADWLIWGGKGGHVFDETVYCSSCAAARKPQEKAGG